MSGGSSETLTQLVATFLGDLKRQNPEWDFEDLLRHLELPPTELLKGLAKTVGFRNRGALFPAEENRILRAFRRGTSGAQEIARETKLPLRQVKEFMERVSVPYGAGGWGMFPWPGKRGTRASERERRPEPRRVSRKGQLSYRGRLYGMGVMYAGEVGWVREEGGKLVVRFAKKPPVTLYKTG